MPHAGKQHQLPSQQRLKSCAISLRHLKAVADPRWGPLGSQPSLNLLYLVSAQKDLSVGFFLIFGFVGPPPPFKSGWIRPCKGTTLR